MFIQCIVFFGNLFLGLSFGPLKKAVRVIQKPFIGDMGRWKRGKGRGRGGGRSDVRFKSTNQTADDVCFCS